ncbi:MAG: hypothetical protein HN600_06070 [Bacteroidetes bacterium]|nr:hypothetical protein [Bacteroidota bacterium]
MKKIILILLVILVYTASVNAKYTQTCKVKYKKNYGWSDYYTVNVIFMSGMELNKATRTYNYESYSTYATIFWGKDEASVIKLSSYTGCGSEVTKSCIDNKVMNLEGEDQDGRDWEICTKSYCF